MIAKDLFENAALLQIIEELKSNGVKFDKYELADSEEHINRFLDHYRKATGATDDILLDILKNDRNDFYKYAFHTGYGNGTFALAMVPMNLVYFAILKHSPDKLEDFMSGFLYGKAPKEARKKIKQYNEAFGIVPEKSKAATKPKPPKTEKRIISAPLHETGLKYSEYDEDYYAILLEKGKEGNIIINPKVGATDKKDGLLVWTPFKPIYKNHKEFRFTDIVCGGYQHMFVSERVRNELGDTIPEWRQGIKGPAFTGKCYLKAVDDYLPYYSLQLPAYKFIDKSHLKIIDGSKGIIYQGDSTDGLEDIVYHSFRQGVMAKMPETERTLFEVDFHSLGWWFCHKGIMEKLEAAGATGVKFVRSMDMNWWEHNEPARRALEEYVKTQIRKLLLVLSSMSYTITSKLGMKRQRMVVEFHKFIG